MRPHAGEWLGTPPPALVERAPPADFPAAVAARSRWPSPKRSFLAPAQVPGVPPFDPAGLAAAGREDGVGKRCWCRPLRLLTLSALAVGLYFLSR